ncbi:hypothetical protein FRX31_030296, partial [Thalictrum thalictroides]
MCYNSEPSNVTPVHGCMHKASESFHYDGIDTEKTFQLDRDVPVGYFCHNGEMYAIVGMRYRCKDCWEK